MSEAAAFTMINACKSIPQDGYVTIQTGAFKEEVYCLVEDNDCGMSQEFIATKLFRPLRSTKVAGWGIGLFQCQQIIRIHGGRTEVESQTGVGTTFTVILALKKP